MARRTESSRPHRCHWQSSVRRRSSPGVFHGLGLFDLSKAYIWNHSQSNLVARGVDEFEILVSSDIDPLTATFSSVGVFNLAAARGNGADLPETVDFGAVFPNVQLVKFDINSAQSGSANDYVGLAEVRFEGTEQPLTRKQFLSWGTETHREITAAFQIPNDILLAETAHLDGTTSGGVGGKAFAWPLSAQFRVYNSLTQYDTDKYGLSLRAFSDQLHAEYWSTQGGYYCCRGGGDRFYDDNSHIAVALAEAYEITGDQVFLERAIDTFDFLLTGEASGANGGSYWSVQDHSFLDTTSSIQGARAALMIYKATHDEQYLDHALRKYGWARDTTQLSSGTFLEKLFLTGPKAGQVGDFDLVHYAGYGIAANVLFYETTGETAYLDEAQRIATTSLGRYFDGATGRINDEGFWAYELVDGLVELYEVDGDQQWYDAAIEALEWLHENKRDPNGHYGRFWGRGGPQTLALSQWDLNDQAPVARAYLQIGLAQVPGDFDADGDVDGSDFLSLQRQGMSTHSLAAWTRHYGSTADEVIGGNQGAVIAVPEPSSMLLVCGIAVGQIWVRRVSRGRLP